MQKENLTVEELRKYFGYLLKDSYDCQVEKLLSMNKDQLLAEFDRIKAAEEKLNETSYLLEAIGWNRNEKNERATVYSHLHNDHFNKTVLNEKRVICGYRKENAKPNTIIYLQDLAHMIYYIYNNKFGYDTETGKINDKYSKKFNEFYEKEYKLTV